MVTDNIISDGTILETETLRHRYTYLDTRMVIK